MAGHVKLDPQPDWATYDDVIVRLDSGELVAVIMQNMAELTGATAVLVTATVVDEHGKPLRDDAGLVKCHLRHDYDAGHLGGLKLVEIQRDCVRAALGEPTLHIFNDAAGITLREAVSIRNRIAGRASGQMPGQAGPTSVGPCHITFGPPR